VHLIGTSFALIMIRATLFLIQIGLIFYMIWGLLHDSTRRSQSDADRNEKATSRFGGYRSRRLMAFSSGKFESRFKLLGRLQNLLTSR